jgi:phage recombination protein Bet
MTYTTEQNPPTDMITMKRKAPITKTPLEALNMSGPEYKLLTETLCKGFSQLELNLFLTQCGRLKLDPFIQQIHGVKRGEGDKQTITLQIGIGGFVITAERTGEYLGTEGPEWCGTDGVWRDVWLEKEPPAASRAWVRRKGWNNKQIGVVTYTGRVQTKPEYAWNEQAKRNLPTGKTVPIGRWGVDPAGQLGKCALAAAFRLAFPIETGALYHEAEGNSIPVPPLQEIGEAQTGTRSEQVLNKLRVKQLMPDAQAQAQMREYEKNLGAEHVIDGEFTLDAQVIDEPEKGSEVAAHTRKPGRPPKDANAPPKPPATAPYRENQSVPPTDQDVVDAEDETDQFAGPDGVDEFGEDIETPKLFGD